MSIVAKDGKVDLSSLTVLQAENLSRVLEDKWGVVMEDAVAFAVAEDPLSWLEMEVIDLSPDPISIDEDALDWGLADLVSLRAEAEERSQSIDHTLSYVQSRCRQVMAA